MCTAVQYWLLAINHDHIIAIYWHVFPLCLHPCIEISVNEYAYIEGGGFVVIGIGSLKYLIVYICTQTHTHTHTHLDTHTHTHTLDTRT